MIKAGIIGATGYAGGELVRLLLAHPQAEIVWYGSRSYIDQKYADVYRNMFELVDASCMDDNMEALAEKADVIFTATPQGLCASLVNDEILSGTKIVDLSADFRLKDVACMKMVRHHPRGSAVSAGSGLRALRDQPGGGEGRAPGGESGLLSHLLHPVRLSADKGRADRALHPSSSTPRAEPPARGRGRR